MRVTIKSTEIHEKKGTSTRGKPYHIREQEAWCALNGETRRVKVTLRDDAEPFGPGMYDIQEDSFYVDNFGQLALGRLVLRVVQQAQRPAAVSA